VNIPFRLTNYAGYRRWDGEDVVLHEAEPEPIVTVIPAVTLWERMTEDEAIAVKNAMETQTVRTVQIFNNATTFRSDHELWPLLETTATNLFGEARAAELLADPSELVSNA